MHRAIFLSSILVCSASIAIALSATAAPKPLPAAGQSKSLPRVLPAEKFFGETAAAYAAAAQIPEVCGSLFCYCGCDRTDGHTSLLDCFATDHGENCPDCREEVILALKMKRAGKTIAEIQRTMDLKYEKTYFEYFSKPTDALRSYYSKRQWKPDAKPLPKSR